ncbi:MAG TPA: hypothetical protein VE844_06545, partial [Gammaproteobacteria bacterium]|nr:hypothetical protein [Gammaproteobacteria bacterium]
FSSSRAKAGSEIGEDHFGIRLAIDGETGGILTAPGQNKAAGGQGSAVRRAGAGLLGTHPMALTTYWY